MINTPLPVYDSGSKPLEVVGERTFNIKEHERERIKDMVVEQASRCCSNERELVKLAKDIFDWVANKGDDHRAKFMDTDDIPIIDPGDYPLVSTPSDEKN